MIKILSILVLSFALGLGTVTAFAKKSTPSLAEWVRTQEFISLERMLRNFSPPGSAPGVIVASPSKENPNYYFHWTRDSSLVMDSLIKAYAAAKDSEQQKYLRYFQDFVSLARRQQLEPATEGLGEPRYLVNGTADTIPWSRPQYDGAALRALTLIRFIKILDEGRAPAGFRSDVIQVIRTDLEYVLKTWDQPCFDLWEELRGFHFYTQNVQYSSLQAGKDFFAHESDSDFAEKLSAEIPKAKQALEKYWDAKNGYIGASHDLVKDSNDPYKGSNLDTAVILAALHGAHEQSFLSFNDGRLWATAHALEVTFAQSYAVNESAAAPAIGRFKDDRYFNGNPWYMTTAAFAELYYRIAIAVENTLPGSDGIEVTQNNLEFLKTVQPDVKFTVGMHIGGANGKPEDLQKLADALQARGDEFFTTLRKYVGSQGEMAEQFDRDAGVPVSARDLTWSYAGFLTAASARSEFITYKQPKAQHLK